MGIEHRLQKMKGKTFLYRTEHYKIIDFEIEEENILIATDKKLLKLNKTDKVLDDFLPVEQEKDNPKSLTVFHGDDGLIDLKKTVIDTIEKIKNDAKYLPQAKLIYQGVQTFTNMVKVEVDIARLTKKK